MDVPTLREILDIKCLESLAEAREQGQPGVSFGTIAQWFEGDDDAGRAWVSRQRELGRIEPVKRMGSTPSISQDGLAFLQVIKAQRADKGVRRRVCRQRLLHWVDCNTASTADDCLTDKFLLSEHAWFAGDIFTADELADAADFLVDNRLLHGFGKSWGSTYARVGLTHEGQECVTDYDADAAAYLAAQRQTGTTVNVHGEGNALAIALGVNSSASATATTINVEAAIQLAEAVRAASSLLDLGEDDEQALLDIAQREDPGKVRRGLQWFAGYAKDASANALGSFIGSVAFALLHMH